MFEELAEAIARPSLFSASTTRAMWDDAHISARMLDLHLDPDVDRASRRAPFIVSSSEWMIDRFALGPRRRVLDLGCGPGLYSTRLAASGASVVGLDFSRRSIDYAKTEATRLGCDVEYRHANYLEDALPGEQDLVIMVMCDYCALGPRDRRRLLERIRDALRPRGRFLFDVYSPVAFAAREEVSVIAADLMDGFWSSDPYVGILRTLKYPSEQVVLDRYLIVEQRRRRTFLNWLQYFSADRLTEEVERAGFVVEAFHGDVGGARFVEEAREFAAVARRA